MLNVEVKEQGNEATRQREKDKKPRRGNENTATSNIRKLADQANTGSKL